jgi:hypothetical protein
MKPDNFSRTTRKDPWSNLGRKPIDKKGKKTPLTTLLNTFETLLPPPPSPSPNNTSTPRTLYYPLTSRMAPPAKRGRDIETASNMKKTRGGVTNATDMEGTKDMPVDLMETSDQTKVVGTNTTDMEGSKDTPVDLMETVDQARMAGTNANDTEGTKDTPVNQMETREETIQSLPGSGKTVARDEEDRLVNGLGTPPDTTVKSGTKENKDKEPNDKADGQTPTEQNSSTSAPNEDERSGVPRSKPRTSDWRAPDHIRHRATNQHLEERALRQKKINRMVEQLESLAEHGIDEMNSRFRAAELRKELENENLRGVQIKPILAAENNDGQEVKEVSFPMGSSSPDCPALAKAFLRKANIQILEDDIRFADHRIYICFQSDTARQAFCEKYEATSRPLGPVSQEEQAAVVTEESYQIAVVASKVKEPTTGSILDTMRTLGINPIAISRTESGTNDTIIFWIYSKNYIDFTSEGYHPIGDEFHHLTIPVKNLCNFPYRLCAQVKGGPVDIGTVMADLAAKKIFPDYACFGKGFGKVIHSQIYIAFKKESKGKVQLLDEAAWDLGGQKGKNTYSATFRLVGMEEELIYFGIPPRNPIWSV